MIIKNGTRVKVGTEYGEVYENDLCNTEDTENVNYRVILDKNRSSNSWHDNDLMLLRNEFEVVDKMDIVKEWCKLYDYELVENFKGGFTLKDLQTGKDKETTFDDMVEFFIEQIENKLNYDPNVESFKLDLNVLKRKQLQYNDIKNNKTIWVEFDEDLWCEEFGNNYSNGEYEVFCNKDNTPYIKLSDGENLMNLETFIKHNSVRVYNA